MEFEKDEGRRENRKEDEGKCKRDEGRYYAFLRTMTVEA